MIARGEVVTLTRPSHMLAAAALIPLWGWLLTKPLHPVVVAGVMAATVHVADGLIRRGERARSLALLSLGSSLVLVAWLSLIGHQAALGVIVLACGLITLLQASREPSALEVRLEQAQLPPHLIFSPSGFKERFPATGQAHSTELQSSVLAELEARGLLAPLAQGLVLNLNSGEASLALAYAGRALGVVAVDMDRPNCALAWHNVDRAYRQGTLKSRNVAVVHACLLGRRRGAPRWHPPAGSFDVVHIQPGLARPQVPAAVNALLPLVRRGGRLILQYPAAWPETPELFAGTGAALLYDGPLGGERTEDNHGNENFLVLARS